MRPDCSRLLRLSLFVSLAFTPVHGLWAQTAVSPQAAVSPRLTQAVDESVLSPIKGTVHPLATAKNDRGAVDESLALERVQVVLKRSPEQEQTLQQAIRDLHTPGSASYHKWLTPEQFGQRFGASDQDIATITAWLAKHGIAVTKVNPGKGTLEFSTSAANFRQTFHTALHKYSVDGQVHYANVSDPQIPAALAPVFGGFSSLNNFPVKPQVKQLGRATYDPATHKATPQWTTGQSGYVPNFLLAPGDFAVQYDLNPLYAAGTKGAGQTIAIINEANVDPALVSQFRTLFGLPPNPVQVILAGADPGVDGQNNPDGPNGASVEAYLDVEEAGAVAPAATVDLVIAADTAVESGLYLAAEHAVYNNVAPVLSLSFGGCEAVQTASGNAFISGLWEQAAAQGQTVVVSTGDSGSSGCDDSNAAYATGGTGVNGLGSTPYNVAVGGTDFFYSDYANGANDGFSGLATYWNETLENSAPTTSLLKKIPEQPWNDSQFGLNYISGADYLSEAGTTTIAGGGGGASSCATGAPAASSDQGGTCAGYAKPSWQSGAGVPADKVRDVPDVSLFAANGLNFSAYPICFNDGDCQPVGTGGTVQVYEVGGTSASTPAFAGIMALVTEAHGRQGQANFVLYPLASQYVNSFNDVTVGNNAEPCAYQAPDATSAVPASADCIAAANPLVYQDPSYGPITEGEIGTGTTPEYNATKSYDLATGLGSVDVNNLVTNWNKVTFTGTAVTLTSTSTNFVHGTPVTLSGTVSPAAATGTVGLTTSTGAPVSPTLSIPDFAVTNGAYTGQVNYLPGGTYTLIANYGGDNADAPGTSTPLSLTVTPEASALELALLNSDTAATGATAFPSGATVPYGTQVQLLGEPIPASCSGNATCGNTNYGIPTGSVTFSDGGNAIGSAIALNADGLAFYNAPFAVGSHSVTANYSGDASYNASSASAYTFKVAQDTPTLYFTSASATEEAGTTALTVQVENNANDTAQYYSQAFETAPSGVVTVTGLPGGTLTLPALVPARDPNTLDVEGVASIGLPASTPAGTYQITVSYPGDANYTSISISGKFTVVAAAGIATTTTASATPTATSPTAPITINLTITGTAAGGVPTGSVLVDESGNALGSLTLPSSGTGSSFTGSFTLDSRSLIQGTNVITLQYSGSSVYAPSFALVTVTNGVAATPGFTLSNSGNFAVAQGSTGTATVTATPAGGFTGAIALSCAVTPTTGTSVPTCTVGSTTIAGSSATMSTVTLTTTSTTTPGPYTVTVTGTSGSISESTTLTLTVNSGSTATPAIALTNGGPITIGTPGGSGTSTITVTPSGGFTGAVALSCAVSPNNETDTPTCSVGGATISGTTAGMATLTVNTTSKSSSATAPQLRTVLGGGVAMATLLFLAVPRRRRKLTTLVAAVLLMAAVGFGAGCGSGSGPTGSGNPGTTTGSYTVTVTGTGTGVSSATTAVTVTVQ